jgi:hypothetical protein
VVPSPIRGLEIIRQAHRVRRRSSPRCCGWWTSPGIVKGASKGEGWATSSSPHPRGRRDRPGRPLLREGAGRRGDHPRRGHRRSDPRHRDHRHRADPRRPGDRRARCPRPSVPPRASDADAIARWKPSRSSSPCSTQGKPARTLDLSDDPDQSRPLKSAGAHHAKRVLYVMPMSTRTISTAPGRWPRRSATTPKEGRRRVSSRCAPRSRANFRSSTPIDKLEMLQSLGMTEPRSTPSRMRRTRCWASSPTTPPARRRSGPGRSHRLQGAPGRGRDPHRLRARLHPRRGLLVDDLVKHKTEKAIKEAGKMRIEGKEYVMQDARRLPLPVQRLNHSTWQRSWARGPDEPAQTKKGRALSGHAPVGQIHLRRRVDRAHSRLAKSL